MSSRLNRINERSIKQKSVLFQTGHIKILGFNGPLKGIAEDSGFHQATLYFCVMGHLHMTFKIAAI